MLYQGPPAGAYPQPVNYPPAGQPYPAPHQGAQPDPYQPPQYPHHPGM